MNLLIIESSTGFQERISPQIFPEAFGMLSMLLKEFSKTNHEIYTVLNNQSKNFSNWLPSKINLKKKFNKAVKSDIDAAVVIAPGKEQIKITKKLKDKNVDVLGPRKKGIEISRDKWKTFKSFRQKLPQPRSWKNNPPFLGKNLVIKPRMGTGSSDVKLTKSKADPGEDFMFQEFIDGNHVSCCLLMNEKGNGTVLSVNEQIISINNNNFEYKGNVIPLKDSKKEKCKKIALKAARELGLCGYCGVDLVVNEKPYLIEINPRITTSFIALSQIIKLNLGKILIKSLTNNKTIKEPKISEKTILAIPRVLKRTKIKKENIRRLKNISSVLAPPPISNGYINKHSPLFLIVEKGKNYSKTKKSLIKKITRMCNILEIKENVVTWT